MTPNTPEALKTVIEKMCNRFDMDCKWFKIIPAGTNKVFRGHTVYLKGRYLTDSEAIFALKRWRMLIGQYFQMPFKLKARVVTRKHNKYITFSGYLGQAPPA